MIPIVPSLVLIAQANGIQLNGQNLAGGWLEQGGDIYVETDWAVQHLGVTLLPPTPNQPPNQQRLKWFSAPVFTRSLVRENRSYIALTPWWSQWRLSRGQNRLSITIPPRQIQAVRFTPQRLVVELSGAVPFQVSRQDQKTLIKIQALPAPQLKLPDGIAIQTQGRQTLFTIPSPVTSSDTQINPDRIVLDLAQTAETPQPTPYRGIQVMERVVTLSAKSKFQVTALVVDLNQVQLRPIWSNPAGMTGTSPLSAIAQQWQAVGAINAGFFNRDRQLPVGAIRRDGQWLAGAALTRGAIAWNDRGEVFLDRLNYSEEIEANGVKIPLTNLNSGYVQKGVARYTSLWGEQYVTLIDNEILIPVQNNQVLGQFQASMAGQSQLPIPKEGYLLVLRGVPELVPLLVIGTNITLKATVSPAKFNDFPHLVGAGPLLLQNGQIVVNPQLEGFSNTFAEQRAGRSAIATTREPKRLLLVAIPPRENQLPTLTETAQILQALGAVHALNLDGGSSTGIYLGGRSITPSLGMPIHSAIGLFLR
ncbi:MAG: phosphodiester glycosidase family protein [Pseudanabaenaceae cyanobacterium]